MASWRPHDDFDHWSFFAEPRAPHYQDSDAYRDTAWLNYQDRPDDDENYREDVAYVEDVA